MIDENRSPQFEITLDRMKESSSVLDALKLLQDAYGIDYTTYHLASTVANTIDAPYVRTTYPDAWISRYLLSGYASIDPIVREGFSRQMPFDWREVEIEPDDLDFLADAETYGVGPNGYSIPIIDKSRKALLSLNSRQMSEEWSRTVEHYLDEWLELAFVVHRKAVFELHGEHDPIPTLSSREIQCLYWAALGKDYKDTAIILKLSEHTIRSYLKSARIKLESATITAASSRAIQLRWINPYINTHK